MNEHHQIGVYSASPEALEKVDPAFLQEGLLRARAKTVEVLHQIRAQLAVGMSEDEARQLALRLFTDHGAVKQWHKPWIRFGEGTVLSFYDPVSPALLQLNDIYHLDLGPVWPAEVLGLEGDLQYEGDYGDTFVFGENPSAEQMISVLHESFNEVKTHWKTERKSGHELYVEFKRRVEERGYVFKDKVDGHRVSDFPHHKYTRDRLSQVAFVPSSGLWILEALVCHPTLKMGAFYEDLLI